jgi:large subunit ribosomal protein L22
MERVAAETAQARVTEAEARRVLDRVLGLPAPAALNALKFGASTTCEPVARLVERALVDAGRTFPLPPEAYVLAAAEVGEGEPMTRVRRQAHGLATWITTTTTRIRVELAAPERDEVEYR